MDTQNKEVSPMLIVADVVKYAAVRKLEWIMAGFMIHIGFILSGPSDVFLSSASFRDLSLYASENSWAILFGAFGIIRLVVLVLNGTHLRQSAELRMFLSMVSFLILFTWIWGLMSSESPLGGVSYKWFAIGELMNVWQAQSDRLARKAAKNGNQ